ncbi:hypothetical protein CVT24_001091 [Panaeolus cyanescens]|uniref:Ubiquitin-like protease family profile domain-containing protein n=1 Tax=Panaeolus cyanescens TaxID=181874 RepID=A0A409YTF4_9AGAR|nr:hypothetical protein CVT24_001091 [Panaeolus cyanescens]
MSVISLSDEEQGDASLFVEGEWIGVGRIYDTEQMPAYIVKAKNLQLQIPREFCSILPHPSASVSTLLEIELPQQADPHSELLVDDLKKHWFHRDPPFSDISVLFHRPIPSLDCLRELEKAFGQAWLDGCKSVSDERTKEAFERFPVWVIRFWREMAHVSSGQSMWRRSLMWLETEKRLANEGAGTTVKEVVGQAERVLTALKWLPWNSPMAFKGIKGRAIYNTLQLTGFLGSGWLTDTHIDIMLEVLPEQSPNVSQPRNAIAIPMSFYHLITFRLDYHLSQPKDKMRDSYLGKLANQIKESNVHRLYFPVHVNNNHWVAGRIDFENKTISYADSLSVFGGIHSKFHKQLTRWLRFWFGKSFAKSRSKIPFVHARQSDSFSCGIITLNAIEHALSGEPLWTDAKATFERLKWFLRAIDFLAANLNPTSVSLLPAQIDSHDLWDSDTEHNSNVQASGSDLIEVASSSESSYSDGFVGSEFSGSGDSPRGDVEVLSGAPSLAVDPPPRSPSMNSFNLKQPFQSGQLPSCIARPSSSLSQSSNISTSSQNRSQAATSNNQIPSGASESSNSHIVSNVEKQKAPGKSRSAVNGRKLRKKTGTQSFPADNSSTRYRSWRTKILKEDPEAGFDDKDRPFQAQCSTCQVWVRGKGGGDTTRFKNHKKICLPPQDEDEEKKPPKKKAKKSEGSTCIAFGVSMLIRFWPGPELSRSGYQPQPKKNVTTLNPPTAVVPCPGLTSREDARIGTYLHRTAYKSGGGRAKHVVAVEMFGETYSRLTYEQKEEVRKRRETEMRWILQPSSERIISSTCDGHVPDPAGSSSSSSTGSSTPQPCHQCLAVLSLHAFTNSLNRKPPASTKDYLHANHEIRVGHLPGKS